MNPLNKNCASGFSLVELMVAITISLLVTLAVMQAYLGGLSNQRAQTDLSRLQESSRFAFDILDRSLRKAGYKNPRAPGTGFCDASPPARLTVMNDPATINPTVANLIGTSVTIANLSDVVRVRYYGEGTPFPPFTGDGSMLDCLGNVVASNVLVEDTFFVTNDVTTGEPSLFCYTSNAAASGNVLLVPGIESLQVLYGDDSDSNGSVNRYVTAAGVSNANHIRSAMLSVVVRSSETTAVVRDTRLFNHFGVSYAAGNAAPSGDAGSVFTAAADGRIRQQFSTTVGIRNLCPT